MVSKEEEPHVRWEQAEKYHFSARTIRERKIDARDYILVGETVDGLRGKEPHTTAVAVALHVVRSSQFTAAA